MKISNIIRYLGLTSIITFCAVSILLSTINREDDSSSYVLVDQDGKEVQSEKSVPYVSYFEDRFYDSRMLLKLNQSKIDKRIVLAEIDDYSIAKLGRFPWSRTVWADVLKKLKAFGAKVIAFDVSFDQPERFCEVKSPDTIFSESIRDFQSVPGNTVILPYSFDNHQDQLSYKELPVSLYNFIIDSQQKQGTNLKERWASKNLFPIDEILETEAALASIDNNEDPDGIFRHYTLLSNAMNEVYLPSLSLLAYTKYTDDHPKLLVFGDADYSQGELKMKTGELNLNHFGKTKIRWLGGAASFPKVPVHQILSAKIDDKKMIETFKNNIVFIGSTALAAHDLRHTPVDSKLPGVYFHMNVVNMLLDGRFLRSDDSSMGISWWMLIGGSLLMIMIQFMGNAIYDLLTVLLISATLFIIDQQFFLPKGYEIRLFFSMFSPIAIYSWNTFLNFYLTSLEKNKIRGTFSSFVAPAIVDQMLANPDKVRVGGERKNITVFFSDVRDFTKISERLTPEELSICLNQYMGKMTDIIFDTNGTLDKYIGDAIVAYWGAPLEVQDHPYHAVKASLQMIEILPSINDKFLEQGFPKFSHGIGINTGECSVGNMGSDKIFSYTALGDSMNLGARLEALCKFYGVQLNVSEYTMAAIPEELRKEFTWRILDKVQVKGKENAVTIYEVLHSFHPLTLNPDAYNDWEESFSLYQNRKFSEAVGLLKPLVELCPTDKSCKRVLEICENFLITPPPEDWNGVFIHTTKG